jgi:DNA repair photolyase
VGYSAWTNPFNGVKSYVSYDKTRFIVFWSKNPKPLLQYIDILKERGIGCYVQYTLNDYEKEGLERGVPSVNERIDTFKQLVDKLGKGSVIWRFDPMILTDKIAIDDLLNKVEYIGDRLLGYTEKLVFSFADITEYRKVKSNLEKNGINYRVWTDEEMLIFAEKLSELNKKWNYELATCGEKIDIEQFGIKHNHCVDDNLMIKLAYKDEDLMKLLGVEIKQQGTSLSLFDKEIIPSDAIMLPENKYAIKKKNNKDKGQRQFCGCIVSKDIGEYNTCPHLCEYCYANASKEVAVRNWKQHKNNLFGESILG